MDFYYTRDSRNTGAGLPSDRPALIFTDDSWNDYGYELMVGFNLFIRGELIHLGRGRFLFEGEPETRKVFNALPVMPGTKLARFDPEHFDFVSLASSLDVYKRFVRASNRPIARDALIRIHDIAILTAVGRSSMVERFESNPAFQKALLRSMAERQAFELAASVVLGTLRPSANAVFTLHMKLDGFEAEHAIGFNFTESLFPGDINALIGYNGIGKTQALVHIADYLLKLRRYRKRNRRDVETLQPEPRFRKVIALSLSPYSIFPATEKVPPRERTDYANIGFHRPDGTLSLATLKRRRLEWMFRILRADDDEYVDEWRRVPIVFRMLERLGIDDLAIRYEDKDGHTSQFRVPQTSQRRRGTTSSARAVDTGKRRKMLFYRGGVEVKLSSGQEQLFLMVLSLLAELEREALVLIDEPELYLHPNLEIEFIALLQELLARFDSFAVISTHSPTVVRELPASCVRVLRFAEGVVPFVAEPDFQTFGADISEIANRVFDNVYARQPSTEWLLRTFGDESFSDVREKYGKELNDEALAVLLAHSRSTTRPQSEP